MVEIIFTLQTQDGSSADEVVTTESVPRVGEFVAFAPNMPVYQVVDVLRHYPPSGDHYVTATACELNWHVHHKTVTEQWWAQHNGN